MKKKGHWTRKGIKKIKVDKEKKENERRKEKKCDKNTGKNI